MQEALSAHFTTVCERIINKKFRVDFQLYEHPKVFLEIDGAQHRKKVKQWGDEEGFIDRQERDLALEKLALEQGWLLVRVSDVRDACWTMPNIVKLLNIYIESGATKPMVVFIGGGYGPQVRALERDHQVTLLAYEVTIVC